MNSWSFKAIYFPNMLKIVNQDKMALEWQIAKIRIQKFAQNYEASGVGFLGRLSLKKKYKTKVDPHISLLPQEVGKNLNEQVWVFCVE